MMTIDDVRALFLEKINQKPKITTEYGFNGATIRFYRHAFKKNTVTLTTMLEVLATFGLCLDIKVGIGERLISLGEAFQNAGKNTHLNLLQPKAYSVDYMLDFLKKQHESMYVCFIEKKD